MHRPTGKGVWLAASATILAVSAAPFAIAAGEGQPLDGGARNPSSDARQSYTRETEVIASTDTYGTRQSNKGAGGGAIYGSRSATGAEPTLRSVNLSSGRSLELRTAGAEAARIEAGNGGDGTRPLTTNATGVATGLNADRVDGFEGAQAVPSFAAVAANGALAAGRDATAATRTAEGTYRVTFSKDVSRCALSATIVQLTDSGAAAVQPVAGAPTQIDVRTRRGGGSDGTGPSDPADRPFHLVVNC